MSERLFGAGALDLRGRDRRARSGVNAGYASANYAATVEARDADDLALLGEMLSEIPVEGVDLTRRVLRDEGNAVRPRLVLGHQTTMSGWR